LRFSGGLHADEVRYGVSSTLAYLPTPRWVLQAGVGVTFGGTLTVPDGRHDFSPGLLALIAADYRAYDNGRTFLLLTSLLSFSAAHTHLGNQASIGYQAADLRLGGEFGVVLADVLRPYALARVFGGPIYWRYAGASVTGTDTHHYQLGAGLALRITRTLNASVEGVPLGERAVAVGIGAAF